MSFNYPPGFSGHPSPPEDILQECKNGHTWYARMFQELGVWLFSNDDQATCPVCGEEAKES